MRRGQGLNAMPAVNAGRGRRSLRWPGTMSSKNSEPGTYAAELGCQLVGQIIQDAEPLSCADIGNVRGKAEQRLSSYSSTVAEFQEHSD